MHQDTQFKRLREVVIGQSGYGFNGCMLCSSRWMRSPDTEKREHDKTCMASPNYQSPASDSSELDALAEKHADGIYERSEKADWIDCCNTYKAGYREALKSGTIPMEEVRTLHDSTVQNVGTSVKKSDMPTFDQWLE